MTRTRTNGWLWLKLVHPLWRRWGKREVPCQRVDRHLYDQATDVLKGGVHDGPTHRAAWAVIKAWRFGACAGDVTLDDASQVRRAWRTSEQITQDMIARIRAATRAQIEDALHLPEYGRRSMPEKQRIDEAAEERLDELDYPNPTPR